MRAVLRCGAHYSVLQNSVSAGLIGVVVLYAAVIDCKSKQEIFTQRLDNFLKRSISQLAERTFQVTYGVLQYGRRFADAV
jgi:hypothetical protein